MKHDAKVKLAIAGGVVVVGGLAVYLLTRSSTSPPSKPPPPIPPREPPGGGGSGIQVGKPGISVIPGPFDPVGSDWKKKNAPAWWPWK